MEAKPVGIGQLRYRVTLANRREVNDPDSGDLVSVFENQKQVSADITPVGTMVFYNTIQQDDEITHRIIIRYQPGVALFDVVARVVMLTDGEYETEVYQIRRVAEAAGRRRFLVIDARLEDRKYGDITLGMLV